MSNMENRKNTPRTETGARRKKSNPTFLSRGSRDELCSTASSLAPQLDSVSSLFDQDMQQSKLTETAPTPAPVSENVQSQTPHYGAPVTRSQFEKMFHIIETQARQRINYDFAAKFNEFAAKISPLIFNEFAAHF